VALAESCFNPQGLLGASIDLAAAGRADVLLFGEAQSRIVISVAAKDADRVQQELEGAGVPFSKLGTVGGEELHIRAGSHVYRWPLAEIHDLWFNSIARAGRRRFVISTERFIERRLLLVDHHAHAC
jgi:phosphoribosylformylglycinamidine synthase